MAEYRVETGLDYSNKRAEPGDIVDDLPDAAITDLLAIHAITPVPVESSATEGEK